MGLVLVILTFNISLFDSKKDVQITDITTDLVVDIFSSTLESTKSNLLSIAISLASDKGIKDAILSDDNDEAYKILNSVASSISNNTLNERVKFQIITKDLYIFARSWDSIFYGMPIEDFRPDLTYMNTRPKVSVEVGRMLSIIATVPIIHKSKVIGYLEIIRLFDDFINNFKQQGIDLFVLLDDKYYDNAIFMQDNDVIDNYIISNQDYNRLSYGILKKIDWDKLKGDKVIKDNKALIIYKEILNFEKSYIGAFVFVINKEVITQHFNQKLMFFINFTHKEILNVSQIINKQKEYELYSNMEVDELLRLFYKRVDRDKLTTIVKQRLQKLNKDQIINQVLSIEYNKKISGEIE